jgi:transcriptional regulator with XRE-family HTH domain
LWQQASSLLRSEFSVARTISYCSQQNDDRSLQAIIILMRTLIDAEDEWLWRLGERLRRWRLDRDETQTVAAARLGVSLSTWRRMESGSPSIPITVWLRAIEFYGGGLEQLSPLLRDRGSRFEALERERTVRRRASSRRRPKVRGSGQPRSEPS